MTKSPEYIEWQARCHAAQQKYQEACKVLWEALSIMASQKSSYKAYAEAGRLIMPEYLKQRAKLYKEYLAACGKPPEGGAA